MGDDSTAGDPPTATGRAATTGRAAGTGRAVALADTALRVAGGVLSVVAALLSGVLELMLASLRWHGALVGVSIVMAVVVNWGLAWFARHSVGRRRAVVLPWGTWTLLMFLAAGSTTAEGDFLVLASNWVVLPMILLGSLGFGVYTYRLILVPPRTRPAPPPANPDPAA